MFNLLHFLASYPLASERNPELFMHVSASAGEKKGIERQKILDNKILNTHPYACAYHVSIYGAAVAAAAAARYRAEITDIKLHYLKWLLDLKEAT